MSVNAIRDGIKGVLVSIGRCRLVTAESVSEIVALALKEGQQRLAAGIPAVRVTLLNRPFLPQDQAAWR